MSVDLLAAFLKVAGAFQKPHSGRTLGHHLLGTYALLVDAGCDAETCLAGGLHSIFGTSRFRKAICDPEEDGWRVSRLFGHYTYDLVFWFANYETKDIDVYAGQDPDDGDMLCLALITAANILEQGGSLDRYPRIRDAWEQQVRSHDNESAIQGRPAEAPSHG
jgi:hypothetical protein